MALPAGVRTTFAHAPDCHAAAHAPLCVDVQHCARVVRCLLCRIWFFCTSLPRLFTV